MKKVLVITNLLPVESIDRKKNENDIILVTEEKMHEYYPDIQFEYLFTTPKVNALLAQFSSRWKTYYAIQKKGSLDLRGRVIRTIGIIKLPQKTAFRKWLFQLSYKLDEARLDKIIREVKPSVLHAHSIDGQAFLAKKLSEKYNIPYIVTVRGIAQNADDLVKNNLLSAKHIIAISPTHKRIAETIATQTVNFIPHGVDARFFVNRKSIENSQPLKFVSVCRLLKLKNLDKVINALAKIKEDFVYDIYGDGPEKEHLEKLIASHQLQQKIRLKGFIKNESLPGELIQYDLFVMPSYPETLGRVYFEAMACGLPVIATRNTGIDGIITDGEQGFLTDLTRQNDLDRIFNAVFSNPAQLLKMKENAKALSDNYKWEQICEKLYSLY